MNWNVIRKKFRTGANEETKKGGELLIIFILIFLFTSKQSYAQQEVQLGTLPEIPSLVFGPIPFSPSPSGEAAAKGQPAEKEEESKTILRGIIVESGVMDTLTNVTVEVFFLDQEGQMQRAYTGLVQSGKFSIPLLPNSTHLLIFRKPGYESQAFLVEEKQVLSEQTFALTSREKASQQEDQTTESPESPDQNPVVLVRPDTGNLIDLSNFSTDSYKLLAIVALHPPAEQKEETQEKREEFLEKGSVDSVPKEEPKQIEETSIGRYVLTAATSFRKKATHESGVLLRFHPNDEVELLERASNWWWRVRYDGQTGYVKAQLLKPKD